MFAALLHRCALIALVALSVLPAPGLAGDINPCALVPDDLVAALTGASATSVRDKAKSVGSDEQDTCHYAGAAADAFVVAYHADPAQFAEIAARPQLQPLAGLGTDALWWSKVGVICALKNGHYISMSYSGDATKAAPSAAYLAAAKAAVAKL